MSITISSLFRIYYANLPKSDFSLYSMLYAIRSNNIRPAAYDRQFNRALFTQLRYYFRFRMPGLPFPPAGVIGSQFGQFSFEIHALNTQKSVFIRIPQGSGFTVVKNKCPFVGPARWNQGQGAAVDFAAVHSRQVNQRSVSCRYRLISDTAVGNFMAIESGH